MTKAQKYRLIEDSIHRALLRRLDDKRRKAQRKAIRMAITPYQPKAS